MKEFAEISLIRNNIRKEIVRAGYKSVELFAYENGLDKSTLSRFFSGQREPRIGTLVRIAHALEIPLKNLMDEAELPVMMAAERPRQAYKSPPKAR